MIGNPSEPFRILSLDGGGIRGAFSAAFLAGLEQKLGCRIADYFDLIAGTSTGAIIAVALALHEPAERIEEFYLRRGPKIFSRREPLPVEGCWEKIKAMFVESYLKPYRMDYDQLKQSKYDGKELRSALDGVFGKKTISDAKTRLVIPAVDMTRGQTVVFKTPHLPDLVRDRHFGVADVLMATTAAPTYFPPAAIDAGSGYADGGMWANNPSMVAIVEALKIRADANRDELDKPIDHQSIFLLSVGTGRPTYFAKPPVGGAGVIWWAPHLFNVSSVSQSQGINFQTQYMLGERAHRIDYDLPDGTWSLDSTDMLAQMVKIGHERSIESLARLRPVFFGGRANHPYHPFPDSARAGI